MKYFGSLCILFILVHFSTQIAKYENCPPHITETKPCECCKVICSGETNIRAQSCALSQCAPGTEIGYQEEDKTKVFPDCCGHPICKNE